MKIRNFRLEDWSVINESETIHWNKLKDHEKKEMLRSVRLPSALVKDKWNSLDFRAKEMMGKFISQTTSGEFRLAEEELTPTQKKKMEKIVLSMKDKEDEFKERYGDEWKSVMYATATKMAKESTTSEGWKSDAQRKAAFASGYKAKGKKNKKKEESTELDEAMDHNRRHKEALKLIKMIGGENWIDSFGDMVKNKPNPKTDMNDSKPVDYMQDRGRGEWDIAVRADGSVEYNHLGRAGKSNSIAGFKKHFSIFKESIEMYEVTRTALDREFQKVTRSGKMDTMAATRHIEKKFGIKDVKLQKDRNGKTHVISFNQLSEARSRSGRGVPAPLPKATNFAIRMPIKDKKHDTELAKIVGVETNSKGMVQSGQKQGDTYVFYFKNARDRTKFRNKYLRNEDIANTTAGVAGLTPDTMGMPVSRMKKKKKRREIEPMLTTESRKRVEKAIKAMNSSDSKEFKSEIDGMPVFRVSEAEFARCKGKKAKGERWGKFFEGDSPNYSSIRKYAKKNPNNPLLVQNNVTGEMTIFRRKMNDGRLKHNKKKKMLGGY